MHSKSQGRHYLQDTFYIPACAYWLNSAFTVGLASIKGSKPRNLPLQQSS